MQIDTDKTVVEARFYISSVKLQPTTRAKKDEKGEFIKNDHGMHQYESFMAGSVEMNAAKHGTFGEATPSGSCQMLIQNEDAFNVFKEAFERIIKEKGRTARFKVYFVEDENQDPEKYG